MGSHGRGARRPIAVRWQASTSHTPGLYNNHNAPVARIHCPCCTSSSARTPAAPVCCPWLAAPLRASSKQEKHKKLAHTHRSDENEAARRSPALRACFRCSPRWPAASGASDGAASRPAVRWRDGPVRRARHLWWVPCFAIGRLSLTAPAFACGTHTRGGRGGRQGVHAGFRGDNPFNCTSGA